MQEEKGRELLRGMALECIHKLWLSSASNPEETVSDTDTLDTYIHTYLHTYTHAHAYIMT